MRIALWVSVVVPSLFIAERLFGWPGVIAHAVAAAIALPTIAKVTSSVSPATARRLAIITGVVVVVVFVIGYRTFDVDLPNRGSDDDDAHEVGVWALLRGENPYAQHTYLGNTVSPMPGSLLLAAPFVLVGLGAAQNLFWLAIWFDQLRRVVGDRQALTFAWVAVGLCLPVVHNVVTGTSHVANSIYVLLGLLWVVNSRGSTWASIAWGVALSSRGVFFFLIPCAAGWLWRQSSPSAAMRSTAVTLATMALLILPFYLPNPAGFTPLNTLDKVARYGDVLPHASIVLSIMTAAIAVAVGLLAQQRAGFFAGCALVLAFPVAATVGLSFAAGRPYLAAVAYGELSMWFLATSAALRPMRPGETLK